VAAAVAAVAAAVEAAVVAVEDRAPPMGTVA
jgi:hypothetical protein